MHPRVNEKDILPAYQRISLSLTSLSSLEHERFANGSDGWDGSDGSTVNGVKATSPSRLRELLAADQIKGKQSHRKTRYEIITNPWITEQQSIHEDGYETRFFRLEKAADPKERLTQYVQRGDVRKPLFHLISLKDQRLTMSFRVQPCLFT